MTVFRTLEISSVDLQHVTTAVSGQRASKHRIRPISFLIIASRGKTIATVSPIHLIKHCLIWSGHFMINPYW